MLEEASTLFDGRWVVGMKDAISHHEGFLYSWQLEAYLAWHLERYSFANQSAALLEENAFFDDEQTRKRFASNPSPSTTPQLALELSHNFCRYY